MRAADYIYYQVLMLCVPPDLSKHTGASRIAAEDNGNLSDIPYLKSIIDFFRSHTTVTLARLLRLEAGGVVKEHTDPTLGLDVPDSVVRLTVPITATDNVDFYLNSRLVDMQPGECWYMKLNDPHRIDNNSSTERVNFAIDVVPNEWVLQQLSLQD